MSGRYCGDLSSLMDDCQGAGLMQLEVYYKDLECELEKALKERLGVITHLREMDDEMARIDGESAVLVQEIEQMKSSLTDVEDIIEKLKERSSEMALQADRARAQLADRRQKETAMQFMEGENRINRLKGALIDLYAEQLVLKAGFLTFAASLKGVSRKARITREINEQTKQYIKDFPILKAEIFELRERITTFKTATAELTVTLRDKFEAERQQTYATAREHKYLCQLYDEEAKILDRLDADLKLQLDSATEIASKLTMEMMENETYFKSLQSRLQAALDRESKNTLASKFRKRRSFADILPGHKGSTTGGTSLGGDTGFFASIRKTCVKCSVPVGTSNCPGCSTTASIPAAARKNLIQPKPDCDQKRAAMKAQVKYLEHKIHQLEMEVYISKMNVEIQMLQTSLKIELWKKSGQVPPSVQLSGMLD
ncbi:uncharacterized protein LOC129590596 isoform X1 [Paramacrobiotus metropolitanus]|uniref:uncharacterized protein LOC129590596 isoform X1 n=1 Tax=Paramacrobiotus metropolitanus TaxID=2943436 RepID=UPI002445DC69|nr:uncharacterized protein LOC129590596 isoform X1 [Paramacrobiotus metropolitanus]XP_055341883.1 uncharacterized protein LOC129590596 isoform X1 [Paramacrobiotus metropolitanus]XP_055341884.1 uncharacterized protein LOC129590596 isoform X1 [Paramacrobiotus metropolitanus]XP_055341885.1 uncharacterized protein LOC129590596 isoform X1 [Paramacrobiotus metropolitanus]